MPDYSQADQPIRVHTALDEDVLLPEGFSGEEALSSPFMFTVDLVSEDPEIDGEALLRSNFRIELDLPDGGTRSIHGIVRRFVQRGRERDLTSYRAEVVPWLWFLSLRRDSRIFQEKDVVGIVEEVFQDQGYSDFEIRCTRSYEPREYTVQYRESNLNFVSRLLEDEGIFYFFEHSESKHVLVLADDMSAIKPCEGQPEARMYSAPTPDEDVVVSLEREHSVHSGVVTQGDYDYLQPSLTLRSTVTGDEPEEIYDYPTGFDAPDGGDRLARLALEREEARRQMIRGNGTCRAFAAGSRFHLVDHYRPDADQTYALLEVRHQARNAAYRGEQSALGTDYRCDFVAMPHAVPYQPPLRTRKPTVHGSQTAQVVGPSGEPIWVDKHGRVKVQFHWDRLGGRDENSSCWVRVSQNWAGKQWGGMFIPHIGHEVIVDFLEGDPDRPIITGRVYNASNTPPQELPANQDKAIIEDHFGNEIVFDATAGEEHIRIHSPHHASTIELGKSLRMSTESDWTHLVEGNSGSIHKGPEFGGNIGFSGSLDMGGKFAAFLGFKISVDIAESFSIALGPSVKLSAGEERKFTKSSFTQHSSKQILLNSDMSTVVIGGSGDQSIIEASPTELILQYGKNPAPDLAKPSFPMALATTISTVAGMGTTILAAQDWQGSEAADGVSYGILGAAGLPAIVPGVIAIAQKVKAMRTVQRDATPRTLHSTIHGRVSLDDQGVMLEAIKGSAAKASLNVSNVKGEITALADKKVSVRSKTGPITMNAKAGFRAVAKRINLRAKGPVTVNGKTVKLG